MGAADVVPGVSGGTIAFITGIYDTLLESIRRINPSLFSIWRKEGVKAAFNHINGFFLIALFAGIFTSIATLAKLITWLLDTHPIPLWSFFFGLILVSVYHIIRQVEQRDLVRFVILLVGVGFAYSITVLKPLHMEPTAINTLFAGAIAICAMILPGISGSFILLLIGMYAPVLAAVKGFQVDTLALFLSGCVIGLLSFSHLLSWLLRKFRDFTLMFLTGLMIGTLPKIWPWKEVLSFRTNSHGEEVPFVERSIIPTQYPEDPQILYAVIFMILGFLSIFILERVATLKTKK